MSAEIIIQIVTILVTWIFGGIAKKHPKYSNELIPVQNVVIGLIVAIIEFIITKDFNTSIAISGLIAGGTYDIVHNLNKIIQDRKNN